MQTQINAASKMDDGVEITSVMIEAGVGAYCARDVRVQSDEEIVAQIWEAMRLAVDQGSEIAPKGEAKE
jgi:hypothetical protein